MRKIELEHIVFGMNTLDDNIYVLLRNHHRLCIVGLVLQGDKHVDDNEYDRVIYLMDIDLNENRSKNDDHF